MFCLKLEPQRFSKLFLCVAAFNWMALFLRPPGCLARPALTADCNVAAYVDAWLLGRSHLYPWPSCRRANPPCKYLDPEVNNIIEHADLVIICVLPACACVCCMQVAFLPVMGSILLLNLIYRCCVAMALPWTDPIPNCHFYHHALHVAIWSLLDGQCLALQPLQD